MVWPTVALRRGLAQGHRTRSGWRQPPKGGGS